MTADRQVVFVVDDDARVREALVALPDTQRVPLPSS